MEAVEGCAETVTFPAAVACEGSLQVEVVFLLAPDLNHVSAVKGLARLSCKLAHLGCILLVRIVVVMVKPLRYGSHLIWTNFRYSTNKFNCLYSFSRHAMSINKISGT
ncbi:uncharacterized protein LOC110760936 [Prunus avium]|uniref:Uncharacterized protein LOC110760936 n=1 Tax=Prunus avium TaxID=42229 RepID=A0A6P5SZ36_PRUAV|nr:uncharacterized protein LOC110760936 [Prunus avium]